MFENFQNKILGKILLLGSNKLLRSTLICVSSLVMNSAQHANKQGQCPAGKGNKQKGMWESWLYHYSVSPSFQGEGLSASLLCCSVAFCILEPRLTPVLTVWKLHYQCSQGWTNPGKLVRINPTQKTLIPPLVTDFSMVSSTSEYSARRMRLYPL